MPVCARLEFLLATPVELSGVWTVRVVFPSVLVANFVRSCFNTVRSCSDSVSCMFIEHDGRRYRALRQGVCRDNCFSQRELCVLCVSAVKFLRKVNHRRAAEFAEGTQSCFPDRLPDGGPNATLSKFTLPTTSSSCDPIEARPKHNSPDHPASSHRRCTNRDLFRSHRSRFGT